MARTGVRVVAGRYRGLNLSVPPGRAVRPTADRVKEALFSILGNRVLDAAVCDCFAGSGALGIEALSRGARRVIFVERDKSALRVLRANLARLGTGVPVDVVEANALRPDRWAAPESVDLILADPPYGEGAAIAFLEGLAGSDLLNSEGVVVVEHERSRPLAHPLWRCLDSRHYGSTSVSFMSRMGTATDKTESK